MPLPTQDFKRRLFKKIRFKSMLYDKPDGLLLSVGR